MGAHLTYYDKLLNHYINSIETHVSNINILDIHCFLFILKTLP